MTAVATNFGICNHCSGEVVVIFPGEVKRSRERLIDVASGAKPLADDDPVGLAGPIVGLTGGEPIAGLGHESFAEGGAIRDKLEKTGHAIARPQHIGVPVGESDVGLDGLAMIALGQRCKQGGDRCEASDVFVGYAAFDHIFALGVAGKEGAMVFLEVGIAMPTRGEHEFNVTLDPVRGIVVAALRNLGVKGLGQFEVYRVFSRPEILVIMHVSLPPEAGLIVKNFALFVQSLVFRSP